MTSNLLNLAPKNVFKFVNNYLDGDNELPYELVMKVRGRGSATFIANNGKDKYSALKEVGCLSENKCLSEKITMSAGLTTCLTAYLSVLLTALPDRLLT